MGKQQASQDEIYQGLKNNFNESFLQLNQQEDTSLQIRIGEYKDLQRKATMLTYMIMNLSVKGIK